MASVSKRKWTHKGVEKEAWAVRYIDADGVRRSRNFEMKKEADAFRRKIERELEDGVHVAKAASQSFELAAREYMLGLERREREGTIRPATYRREESFMRVHIVPWFRGRSLAAITEQEVSDFINHLRDGPLGPHSTLGVMKTLGRLMAFGQRRKWIKVNVLRDVRAWPENRLPTPTRIRTLNRDEAAAIYRYFCDPRAFNPTWSRPYAAMGRAIVWLGMFAGLRSGEIRGLTWGAVDFEAGTVRVYQQLTEQNVLAPPKTPSSIRTVPVPDIVLEAIEQYRRYAKPNPDNLIFTCGTATPFRSSALHNDIWKRALVDLGYSADDEGGWPHFHALRHFASSMMVQHMAIGDVGPMLGHRDFDTTLRVYTGATLTAPAKRAAVQDMAKAILLPPVAADQ